MGELERRALLENTERDTIPSDTKEAGSAVVRYIGKIDRGIYKCVTPDITTDEVVITEERIEHCNGHDRAYEKYAEYIGTVLSDPDLILKDTRPHTGIVVRRIDVNGKSLQLVLRLHTSQDDPDYRNSILSFWDISESRRRNYESLYKRDGFGYNIDASEDL